MELNEALAITKKYQNVGAPTPDEEFLLTEAYAFLIDFYGDSFDGSVYMYNLGDHYLRRGEYGLARKYLERCAALDNTVACMPLGMIWYYGLAGETDYAKAFTCFEKTKNFPLAKLMLAEMYQEGRGTARDESLRRQYVRDAFEQVWDSPVPNNKGEAFCKYAELLLEDAPDGSRETELFFCDPYCSSQKPRVEKNHTLFRDIVPKGTSFDRFTQEDVNFIFSHVNSVKRKSLNQKTPYELFCFLHETEQLTGANLAGLLGIEPIPANDVVQSPSLLKQLPSLR